MVRRVRERYKSMCVCEREKERVRERYIKVCKREKERYDSLCVRERKKERKRRGRWEGERERRRE